MKYVLFALLLAFASIHAQAATSRTYATCSLYKGDYFPGKKADYQMDVISGEFVMPQININFDRGQEHFLYWAGLHFRIDNAGKNIPFFSVNLNGFDGPMASAQLIAGQRLEVILTDGKSDSTLRCFSPAVPN